MDHDTLERLRDAQIDFTLGPVRQERYFICPLYAKVYDFSCEHKHSVFLVDVPAYSAAEARARAGVLAAFLEHVCVVQRGDFATFMRVFAFDEGLWKFPTERAD